MAKKISYENCVVLAPMVRCGTLPLRLLSLRYGADLVYCEELIDWRLLRCKRVENRVLDTVDYIDQTDNSVVFRTCKEEAEKVVLQMGTCDPQRALQVAKFMENDVAAFDVNMGCPKEFSLKGGMGAALLTQPEKIRDILTTLVKGVSKQVTCKIRVFPSEEETIALCKVIETTGVSALAVHGRTKEERPRHQNRDSIIQKIAQVLSIPVIANGVSKRIHCREDAEKFRENLKVSGVMLARAAQWNCSVFRKEGPLPVHEVIKEYIKLAVETDNAPSNTKYTIQGILGDEQESELGKKFLQTQTLREICDVWDLGDFYERKQEEFNARRKSLSNLSLEEDFDLPTPKRQKTCVDGNEVELFQMPMRFIRRHYTSIQMPKQVLHEVAKMRTLRPPVYETEQRSKTFFSTVKLDGCLYQSSSGEKNKRYAEQASALVCLVCLDIDPKKGIKSLCQQMKASANGLS